MPRMKSTLTLARMGCVLLFSPLMLCGAQAQATIDVVIFRSADSLTVYLPPSASVSISGLTLEATTAAGRNLSQLLEQLPSFRGLPYDRLPTPICFHITRAVNSPLPLECQTITTLTQTLVDANVFWYDISSRVDRTLVIYLGMSVQICPAGSPRCELVFSVPPTPIPLGFSGNPVTSNDQWRQIIRSFDAIPMALVPAGRFEMGSTPEEIEIALEMCQSTVDENAVCERWWFEEELQNGDNIQNFSQPFWIDLTEVTRSQYQRCVDAGACESRPVGANSFEPDHPITEVNLFHAMDYCGWRSTLSGSEVRLPTEAEWEYAARGPDRLLFPWGNTLVGNLANHCDEECAEFNSGLNFVNEENNDGYAGIAPVGSFPAGMSWVGALDMSGNVMEWTTSLANPYPYAPDDENDADTTTSRIMRGGGYLYATFNLLTADRYSHLPVVAYDVTGIRCLREY